MIATLEVIDRRQGIGGTDISAILGMNPWRQAWDVWAEKTGKLEPVAPTARMKWGKRLERIIAEAYSEETGRPVVWVDETRRHPERAWQIWTPDFLCTAEPRGGDAKTAGIDRTHEWGESGTDMVPDPYFVQAHWYMSASGLPAWDLAVLIAGNDFRIYTIECDTEVESALLLEAELFWKKHIIGGEEPPISNTDAAADYIRRRFPRNLAALRQATTEEVTLLLGYRRAREAYEKAEAEKEALENAIKVRIGEAAGIEFDGGRVTWKATKGRLVVDWEAVAREMGAPLAVIEHHTESRPGSRRFLSKFSD